MKSHLFLSVMMMTTTTMLLLLMKRCFFQSIQVYLSTLCSFSCLPFCHCCCPLSPHQYHYYCQPNFLSSICYFIPYIYYVGYGGVYYSRKKISLSTLLLPAIAYALFGSTMDIYNSSMVMMMIMETTTTTTTMTINVRREQRGEKKLNRSKVMYVRVKLIAITSDDNLVILFSLLLFSYTGLVLNWLKYKKSLVMLVENSFFYRPQNNNKSPSFSLFYQVLLLLLLLLAKMK